MKTTEDGRKFVTDSRRRAWFVQETFEGTIKGGRVVLSLACQKPGESWADWAVVAEQYRDGDREPRQVPVLFEGKEQPAREQFAAKVEQLKGVQQ